MDNLISINRRDKNAWKAESWYVPIDHESVVKNAVIRWEVSISPKCHSVILITKNSFSIAGECRESSHNSSLERVGGGLCEIKEFEYEILENKNVKKMPVKYQNSS